MNKRTQDSTNYERALPTQGAFGVLGFIPGTPFYLICTTKSELKYFSDLYHDVFQCVAVCFSVFQCVAVCCSVLQCIAVCCSVLLCAAARCHVLLCVVVCCSVLQCVASVLHCVASLQHTETHYTDRMLLVGRSMLQCVAVCCSEAMHCNTLLLRVDVSLQD